MANTERLASDTTIEHAMQACLNRIPQSPHGGAARDWALTYAVLVDKKILQEQYDRDSRMGATEQPGHV